MSNKKKKKAKNSDYRYLEKKNDEWREQQEKAERSAEKKKNRWLNVAAAILVIGSLIAGVYSYSTHDYSVAPLYTLTSGVGIMLMALSSKNTRPKFYKVGMGMGVAMLLLAYYIARTTGLLGTGGLFG